MDISNSTLLGSPLSDLSIEKILNGKTKQLEFFAERLKFVSSHSEYILSIPRLVYFLRCSPTWKKPDILKSYDDVLKSTLEYIINCNLSDEAWSQSSLPIKQGGLGIKHSENLAIPAFLSSFYSVQNLISNLIPDLYDSSVFEAQELWKEITKLTPPTEVSRNYQISWERPTFDLLSKHLLSFSKSQEDTARILASQSPETGAWLQTFPSPQLGTFLPDNTFRIACCLRLGCRICIPHRCPCGTAVDEWDRHGLSCKYSSGRRFRHESVNDVIARAFRSAEVPSIREPSSCFRSDGKRPDGMTLIPCTKGKVLIWDFTCTDTYAASYIHDTTVMKGSAAKLAEERKNKKYEFTNQNQFMFVPIAIETSGVWGSQGQSLIQQVGKRISLSTGEKRATTYLIQRISLIIQSGNAASIFGTLPVGRSLEEIFSLW